MKFTLAIALVAVSLAGCADDGPAPAAEFPAFPMDVYRFHYAGSDVGVRGVDHGWLLRVSNPTSDTFFVRMMPDGVQDALYGPVTSTGGDAPQTAFLPQRITDGVGTISPGLALGPGESGVFLAQVSAYPDDGEVEVGATFVPTRSDGTPYAEERFSWTVNVVLPTTLVMPGDHVHTTTVGVWINGTSFYSNAAAALADPAFPYGWSRPLPSTDALPIYVYGTDPTEQPAGSADRCWFTTITGYNNLLQKQAEGSTGVALLRPERAYTLDGNEDHDLYGDSLIFLNTVTHHAGATGLADVLPDPTGACFPSSVNAVLAQSPVPISVPPTGSA